MALSFEDEFHVSRLKHFAERTLQNPKWTRDPDYVLVFLEHGPIGSDWPYVSEFRDQLREAADLMKEFRRYARGVPGARRTGNDAKADKKWEAAATAITSLITAAETKHGGRLRVWR